MVDEIVQKAVYSLESFKYYSINWYDIMIKLISSKLLNR